MAEFSGVPNDDGVSKYLKCTITQVIGGVSVNVTGYLTESCEMELRSLWESPFGQDTVGNVSKTAKGAGIIQSETEMTSVTQWNSQQTWEGIEPPEVTIQLKFIAYTNAYQEVNKPIMRLMQMASPDLLEKLPVDADPTFDASQMSISMDGIKTGVSLNLEAGRIPAEARFDLGRMRNLNMRISSVSFDVNAPKTPTGHFAYNTVTITAAPKQMFNRSEIPSIFS